jgi:uncharacterized protein (TIGR02284 family)
MNTTSTDTAEVLNSLIETCCDGAKGFEDAAEKVDAPELIEVFHALSAQRRIYAEELRACVKRMGNDPEDSGTLAAKAHRGWLKLRDALSTNKLHPVLAECERGEDYAVAAYQEALEKLDDPSICDLVRRQARGVKTGHDRIRDLRDSPTYQNR